MSTPAKPNFPPPYPPPDILRDGYEAYKAHEAHREAAEQVRGKHFTEWGPELDRLRAEKNDAATLPLLMECIEATERGAGFSGREPAPAYTKRAAIIFRRQKNYQAEIDIIERWERACPPEMRGPGATQDPLIARKAKARELLARQV